MNTKIAALVCGALLYCSSPVMSKEELVQVVPAVNISETDAKRLKEINKMLHERQHIVDKIMAKEGLKRHKPFLPDYSPMSDNSVQALLNQIDYTMLAEKLGAAPIKRPDLETGVPLKNNRFLHTCNNLLLRSIAVKLGIKTPNKVDTTKGTIEEQCFALVSQNNEIVKSIAEKEGCLK